jgi:hypothetical protein
MRTSARRCAFTSTGWGDLLFNLARYANHAAGTADLTWAPRAKAPES